MYYALYRRVALVKAHVGDQAARQAKVTSLLLVPFEAGVVRPYPGKALSGPAGSGGRVSFTTPVDGW